LTDDLVEAVGLQKQASYLTDDLVEVVGRQKASSYLTVEIVGRQKASSYSTGEKNEIGLVGAAGRQTASS